MGKKLIIIILISFFYILFYHQNIFAKSNLITEELIFEPELSEDDIKEAVYARFENRKIISVTIKEQKSMPEVIEKIEEKSLKNKENALQAFDSVIEVNDNGYKGQLNRKDETLEIKENEIDENETLVEKIETKYYRSLDTNDVSYVEKEINQNNTVMKLKDLNFVVTDYEKIGDSEVPCKYDAIARYSYQTSVRTQNVVNYKATVVYSNSLRKLLNFKVTVVMEDTEMQENINQNLDEINFVLEEELPTEPTEELKDVKRNIDFKPFFYVLKIILLIVVSVAATYLSYYMLYQLTNDVQIYSSFHGIFKLIGRARIKKSKNKFNIDLTKFGKKSTSKIFKIVVGKKKVEKLDGETIEVSIILNSNKYIRTIKINYSETITSYEYTVNF